MELLRCYLNVLLIALIVQCVSGGIFKKVPFHQQDSLVKDLLDVDEKEIPLKKRQTVPIFQNLLPPILSEPNSNQPNEHQEPIRVPIHEFIQQQQPHKVYEINPFLSNTVSASVPPVTSTPVVTTTHSYTNNPFFNAHQVNSNQATFLPVTTKAPAYDKNPFFNVQSSSVQTSRPVEISTTAKPAHVNPNNPFLNPSTSVQNKNPFLNVYTESVLSSHPIQITTTVAPEVPLNHVNSMNPFLNPTYYYSTLPPTITDSPAHPTQPQEPQDRSSQLRSFCAKARGQFPSGRCNTFVNCWDNVAVEQTCPPGLVFNYAGYCDYPVNVNCHGRSVDAITDTQPPQTVSLMISTGTDSRNPSSSVLPSETIYPRVPDVVGTLSPIVYVPAPVDEKLKSKCVKPRGQFPSDICNRYINCWDDAVQEVQCPDGLYFSDEGYCDYLHNVNCQNRTLEKAFVTQSSICPHPDGNFRDKHNCSRYYVCINNVVLGYHDCPPGLDFNEMIGICDYKYNVDCNREPFVYQTPQIPQNNVEQKPAGIISATQNCVPGKVFRLASDCSSAVLCRQGMTEVVYCPSGLAYDAPSDRCLPQQLAKCQDI